jgi:hypothetical protein
MPAPLAATHPQGEGWGAAGCPRKVQLPGLRAAAAGRVDKQLRSALRAAARYARQPACGGRQSVCVSLPTRERGRAAAHSSRPAPRHLQLRSEILMPSCFQCSCLPDHTSLTKVVATPAAEQRRVGARTFPWAAVPEAEVVFAWRDEQAASRNRQSASLHRWRI